MRVAAIGRTEVMYKSIELLIENGFEVPLIITAKESPESLKTAKDFENLATKIGAKFLCTSKLSDSVNLEFIKKCNDIDIAVSINYSSIISEEIISSFRLGVLNSHGGDLPKYRGNACQAWAILNGESKIGLCIHSMIGGEIDSGNIIAREFLDIDINTKITKVWNWIEERTPYLFLSGIKKLENDKNYCLEIQSKDSNDSLRCYPRIPEDGKINWNKTNEEILRLVNASNKPYSGAFTFFDNKKLIIWDAEIFDDNEIYLSEVGQISHFEKDGSIYVIAGEGKLKINLIEYEDFIGKPGTIIKTIRKRLG